MSFFSFLGSHCLSLSFPAAVYSLLMFLIGQKRNDAALIVSAKRANFLSFALITGAVFCLVAAFVSNDFSIRYVYGYSSQSLPFFYKLTGLWAGLDGSILFWAWLVSLYGMLVLAIYKDKDPSSLSIINAVMMAVVLFFITILFVSNPFSPMGQIPADGRGLNPLLQNIAMVTHPPALYLGFTAFTVPFAFVIAALITRTLDATWIVSVRIWTIIAWCFLTVGNFLGAAWAYVELGWGGFWAWDPVENTGLLPWLAATAYLHSVIVQQKRGMFKVWNVVLIVLTFVLTIFGTYLTRSGGVQSVHAFSESKLGPYFVIFLLAIIFVSIFLIVTRRNELKSNEVMSSFLSKESAFLINNVVLVVAVFAVLWGTMFPVLAEWVTGQKITVGQPFFNTIMAPIGLLLVFLMGIGPVIPWRQASWVHFKNNLALPLSLGFVAGLTGFIFGVRRQWYGLMSIMVISFVMSTILLEVIRGTRVIKRQQKTSVILALKNLFVLSNRRYGGYLIHFGVLLVFIGIAGAAYKTEADFSLLPGETYQLKEYRFDYERPTVLQDENKETITTNVALYKNNALLGKLKSSKRYYPSSDQTTTEVDIHLNLWRDVYLILGNFDSDSNRADFRAIINPLISFVWMGACVMLFGVVVVLLPRRSKNRSAKKGVVAFATLAFMVSLLFSHSVLAQDQGNKPALSGGSTEILTEKIQTSDALNALDPNDPLMIKLKAIAEKLICQCPGCVRESMRWCSCEAAVKDRARILALLRQGRTPQEIIDFFVDEYGVKVFASPEQKGFFNVGYWLPAIVLFVSLILMLWFIKKRFSKDGKNKEAQSQKSAVRPGAHDYEKDFLDEFKDHYGK